MTNAKYIGPCWEYLQTADGTLQLTKLYVYWRGGERRFALTEEAARSSLNEGGGA